MGNQGSSAPGVRQVCDWIYDGQIGEVTRVEAFTDRPIWPQGLNRPAKADPIPSTLKWDLFIGPAPMRPFINQIYTPWNWRGWWDFGTGALGDMACHILHPVFKGLRLGYPTKVEASSTMLLTDSAPVAQKVRLVFPARENLPKVAMPEVEVIWYDGGLQPFRPEGVAGKDLNDTGGCVIFHGTKDTLTCAATEKILGWYPEERPNRRRLSVKLPCHTKWIGCACKESPENRVETASPFSEAGPFNEMVVMGVVAVRLQGLNQELEWDGENMVFTNIPENATVRTIVEDNFKIVDGDPKFDKKWTEPVNARAYAAELIKHTYREP